MVQDGNTRRKTASRSSYLAMFLCVWLGLARWAGAQQEILLEQAINTAIQGNRDLKLAGMALESAELSVSDARAAFSFTVRPEGDVGTTEAGDELAYGLSASRKTAWGTRVDVRGQVSKQALEGADDYHRGYVQVQLEQPLLRSLGPLMNRESVTKAESQVMAARREMELRKTDLVIQVVEAYEEIFRLQKQVEFDTRALLRLEKMNKLTSMRERQGRVSRVDVLRVELQYGEARLRLNRTQEQLASVRADFAELLGASDELSCSAIQNSIPEIGFTNRVVAQDVALKNRLDYAQVLHDAKDAARGKRIARRNLLPDLSLISRYEQSGSGNSYSAATDLNEDSWFVGLAVESDLLLRQERIRYSQSILDEKTALQTTEIVEAGIRRQVTQAILTYERTHAEVLFAERNYHLAESRATLARRLFEMGKGDSFSVTDAEDALLQAQNQMLQAGSEALLASYRLLRAVGLLIEYPEDLKPAKEG